MPLLVRLLVPLLVPLFLPFIVTPFLPLLGALLEAFPLVFPLMPFPRFDFVSDGGVDGVGGRAGVSSAACAAATTACGGSTRSIRTLCLWARI